MRKAIIYVHNQRAGILSQEQHGRYRFVYDDAYDGEPVSLTLPKAQKEYSFEKFPSFFEGLLPDRSHSWQPRAQFYGRNRSSGEHASLRPE